MLDALIPAAIAFEAAGAADADLATATRRAADAAEAGALETLPLVATKGRASYLGERSVGHLDPGAVSSALILRALADVTAGPRLTRSLGPAPAESAARPDCRCNAPAT